MILSTTRSYGKIQNFLSVRQNVYPKPPRHWLRREWITRIVPLQSNRDLGCMFIFYVSPLNVGLWKLDYTHQCCHHKYCCLIEQFSEMALRWGKITLFFIGSPGESPKILLLCLPDSFLPNLPRAIVLTRSITSWPFERCLSSSTRRKWQSNTQ